MADYRSMYDSNFIYAYDLKGKEAVLTIARVEAQKLRGSDGKAQKKPVVWFKEIADGRGLALCKTNARIIAALYGTETDKWVGQALTLYPTQIEAFGGTVDAIRIRPVAPKGVK